MQLSIEEELQQQQQQQQDDTLSSPLKPTHSKTTHAQLAGSTSSHLSTLFDVLRNSEKKNRAVIFFLEDFDRFAVQGGGAQNHQALLYNLLDMTHHSGMQFAVLGTSVRTDVLQLLEKRVRSRFSQLTVVMTSAMQQPNHLLPLIYSRLAVPHAMQVKFFSPNPNHKPQTPNHTHRTPDPKPHTRCTERQTLTPHQSNPLFAEWNERLELLLCNRDVWGIISGIAERARDLRPLLHFLSLALSHVNENDWLLRPEHLKECVVCMQGQEHNLKVQLQGLTPLQQVMLGAVLRLVTREYAVITFAAVMQQFREFVSSNRDNYCYVAAANYSDSACAQAVDELVAGGLVEYVEANACRSRTRQEYRAMAMLAQPCDVKSFFLLDRGVSPQLKEWAGRDVTSNK